jgi:hypothetical protein
MPAFCSESDVRLRFQLNDAVLVTAELIEACIDDAHLEIERFLDETVDVDPPDAALVTGETLLAGAYLYRSLAAKDAFQQKQVTIGGQRIEAGERFRALMAVAALTEKQAWFVLEPYLTAQPARLVIGCTDSTPVLGEV